MGGHHSKQVAKTVTSAPAAPTAAPVIATVQNITCTGAIDD